MDEQLTKEDQRAVLWSAVQNFGGRPQIIKAVEEMAELQKELCKRLAGADNADEIAEEMADVEIMLEQLRMIYDNTDAVRNWRQRKVARLKEQLRFAKGHPAP